MNQQRFSAAVRDAGGPAPVGLRVRAECDPLRRLDVYRNNHFASLVASLEDNFVVCRALVGEPFFREMARAFVQSHPPRSPVLAEYGRLLPGFIDAFEPAASVPYLADVARLEQLRIDAWHAGDARLVSRSDFERALASAERLPQLRLALHPTVGALRSRYAIGDIWMSHQGMMPIESVDPMVPQGALVSRPDDVVQVTAVHPATALLVETLADALPLAAALEAALNDYVDVEPGQVLTELLQSQAVAAIGFPTEHDA